MYLRVDRSHWTQPVMCGMGTSLGQWSRLCPAPQTGNRPAANILMCKVTQTTQHSEKFKTPYAKHPIPSSVGQLASSESSCHYPLTSFIPFSASLPAFPLHNRNGSAVASYQFSVTDWGSRFSQAKILASWSWKLHSGISPKVYYYTPGKTVQ